MSVATNQAASIGVFRGTGDQRMVGSRGALLFGVAVIVLSACAIGSFIGGSVGLALTSAATLATTWVVLQAGNTILPNSYCFKAVVCIYGSQSLVQLLVALYGITTCTTGAWGMDIAEHSGALALGHLSLLGGTALAAVVYGSIIRRKNSDSLALTQCLPKRAQYALVAALLVHVLQPILGQFLPETLAWMLSVLGEDLEAVAFFVGWFAGDLGTVVNGGVLVVLVLNVLAGGLRGTRYPIMLLGLYLVGRLISPRERRRAAVICTALAAAFPIVVFFSMVGDIRSTRGLGSVELLKPSHWSDFFEGATVSQSNYDTQRADPIGNVLYRLYAWPNAASVILTPDPVPYRGFAGWSADWGAYFRFGTWSPEAREDYYQSGYGTQQASHYGFLNQPGSAVEFGVIADGWSTAGPLGVVIMGFLAMLALCLGEELGLYSKKLSYTSKLIFLCILLKACIQCYVYPTPLVIRYVALYTCFWLVLLKTIDALRMRHQYPFGRQTSVMTPGFAVRREYKSGYD